MYVSNSCGKKKFEEPIERDKGAVGDEFNIFVLLLFLTWLCILFRSRI